MLSIKKKLGSSQKSLRKNKSKQSSPNNNTNNKKRGTKKEKHKITSKYAIHNVCNNSTLETPTTTTATIDTSSINNNNNCNITESQIHNLIPGFYEKTEMTNVKHKPRNQKINAEAKSDTKWGNKLDLDSNVTTTDKKKCSNHFPSSAPNRIVLLQAVRIFQSLQHQNEMTEPMKPSLDNDQCISQDLLDELEMRSVYDLSYSTLKYQRILTDLLELCQFYRLFPQFVSEHPMVMVILCSLMKTKFEEVPLKEKDTTPLIEDIQKAICSCKTKLNAWLARHRILANASSIEYLLPEQVRNKDKMSSQMNVYVWVNQQKTSIDKVIIIFLEEGFILTTDNVDRGKVFAKDPHCYDLLVFSSDFKLYLRNHHLLKNGNIVIQDKSSCIAPQSVASLIRDDDEVLHVNIGSGLSTAHISSLLYTTKFRIWGLVGPHQLKLAQKNMQILDIKNVKLLTDCFLDLSPEDERFKSVRIIVLTAKCSKSALNNPIDYVINEGEDISVLKTLSRDGISEKELKELSKEETYYLQHSFRFPNVKSVLYLTRSVHRIENEETVMNVVDYANTLYKLKKMFKVVIPVLPFYKDDIEYKNGLQDKFIKFEPSIRMNGCFLAIIGLMKESDSFRKVFPKLNRNRKSTNGKRSQSKSNLLVYNQIYSRIKTEEPISMEQRVLNISKPNKINSLSPTIPAISSPLLSYTKKYSLTCSSSTDAFVRPIHSQSPPLSSHYFPKHSDILTRKTLPSVRLAWSGKSCEFIKTCMAEHKKIVNHPKPFR